ncbi:MAG TPA: hypothetical protein DCZ95_20150 [Verrucomicrobia bacterium]|nr:MAG: hypothetical protein A2X46_02995 [Lentisphaerae bacterium GWF2_57_35]HBA86399.1 hypothetical protein [Verrucomicrobiota bacterium]
MTFRAYRAVRVANDFREQVRYLIENGGTIGEAPATETFSTDYLEAIFGDNPDLLDQLKTIVSKGLSDEPTLNLGEVSAMIVTYNKSAEDKVDNVVAHAVGGFPLGKMKMGFHRDGYFARQIDRNLWNMGNVVISFLGRDMVLFAEDEVAQTQHELLESIFSGDISLLVKGLEKPMFFTAVFPDPKRIVPSQLRGHIQAVVIKGSLGFQKGHFETLLLCPNQKSAAYVHAIVSDMKKMADLGLKTRWGGAVVQTAWGPMVGSWWAYEMVRTLEETKLETEEILVRIKTEFGRVMVNVCLKSIERMSRDLAALKGTFEDRLDPRVVDARLKTQKPLHYWSEPHQWGPDWPIPPPANTNEQAVMPELGTTNVPVTTAQVQPSAPTTP